MNDKVEYVNIDFLELNDNNELEAIVINKKKYKPFPSAKNMADQCAKISFGDNVISLSSTVNSIYKQKALKAYTEWLDGLSSDDLQALWKSLINQS